MVGLSLAMAILAVNGLVGCQIYLRIALRDASRCRSVDQLVVVCTAAALIGLGLATWDCVASGECFTPQRVEQLQWERSQLMSFGRHTTPAQP